MRGTTAGRSRPCATSLPRRPGQRRVHGMRAGRLAAQLNQVCVGAWRRVGRALPWPPCSTSSSSTPRRQATAPPRMGCTSAVATWATASARRACETPWRSSTTRTSGRPGVAQPGVSCTWHRCSWRGASALRQHQLHGPAAQPDTAMVYTASAAPALAATPTSSRAGTPCWAACRQWPAGTR